MNAPLLPPLDETLVNPDLAPAMPEEPVLPLSVEGYHALLQAGVLQDGDPIELLEGFLVPKMTKGHRHAAAKRRLLRLLAPLIPPSCFLDSQEVITVADSEPEPDLFVVKGSEKDFEQKHPGPGDLQLIVEISESSLRRDRNIKKRIYARAAIASYWVVNLVNDCIEVFTQPGTHGNKPGYAQTAIYRTGDEIPVLIDSQEVGRIAAAEILGEPKK